MNFDQNLLLLQLAKDKENNNEEEFDDHVGPNSNFQSNIRQTNNLIQALSSSSTTKVLIGALFPEAWHRSALLGVCRFSEFVLTPPPVTPIST